MKKTLCILLSSMLLVTMFGCQIDDNNNAHTFYYPRSDYGYDALEGKFHESAIKGESREVISSQSLLETINVYLTGPIAQDLTNPYPKQMSLETVSIVGRTLYITVSDHLSELTGIRLMIACACLGKTSMELTNTNCVVISCKKALLDGKKTIILHNDQVIIEDLTSDTAREQE